MITRFQFLNVIAFVLVLGALALLQSATPEREHREEVKTPVRPRTLRESGGGGSSASVAEAKAVDGPDKKERRSQHADAPELETTAAAQEEPAGATASSARAPWARHAALFTRPEAEPFRAVDPVQPGNSLPLAGGRVFIESHRAAAAGTTSPELEVSFSKDAPASSDGQSQTSPSAARQRADLRPGLTYEQELFRTKWGWVAFDLSQRAGSELGAEQ